MKRLVLVAGGSGLVGTAIKNISKEYNLDFLFPTRSEIDWTDLTATRAYFYRVKPEIVIHLAANVGGLYKNMKYKVEMLEQNLLINYNILKCCHEFDVIKVVSCLSTCIFPDKTAYPIDETMLHNGPPHSSNNSYAYAKRMLDIHSRAYNEQYGHNFVTVIPTNVYGPHDNYNLEEGHVVPALIHRCMKCKEAGEPFIVKGSGNPLRQFIYAEDLAYLILWVAENYNSSEPIILAPDERDETSIGDVARIIARCYDYEDNIVFDTTASDGQFKKTASNKKLRDYLPDFRFTPLIKGIIKTVSWFQENYEQARK